MNTLIPILIQGLFFAYLTDRTTIGEYGGKNNQTTRNKVLFALLVLTLALPVGLRQSYNDTAIYIKNFNNSATIMELLASGKIHILMNPAFEMYTVLIRSFTSNYHIFLMIPAIFVQYAFIKTIRRYSSNLTFSIAVYVLLGTYVFSMAAMKQTIAMAILMLALPFLMEKKYKQYYLLVFVAFLFHTYAISFVILPLFFTKPWSARTFILLIAIVAVMGNFERVIGFFLDFANEGGKNVAEEELFDNIQINIYRVLVYAVIPLMSLILSYHLFQGRYESHYDVLIHMSIISFAVMLLGTISAANMFGRMANYFEIGTICSLPWIIDKPFSKRSSRIVAAVALVCYFAYFYYAYSVNMDFDQHYQSVTIVEFIQSLFGG